MDGQQFDDLARQLAGGRRTRRSILRLLGGAVAGMFVAAGPGAGAAAETCLSLGSAPCGAAEECCVPPESGVVACESSECCLPTGATCYFAGGTDACCPGRACTDTGCCAVKGGPCHDDGDCCAGSLFCQDGICVLPCYQSGSGCFSTEECCEGLTCHTNACLPCGTFDDACEGDGDCCTGLVCAGGTCAKPSETCKLLRETCDTAADCCDPGWSCYGQGSVQVCCLPDNVACDLVAQPDEACCGDLVCRDGICQPEGGPSCAGNGEACPDSGGCCTGTECRAGTCVSCAAEGATCGNDDACCAGSFCAQSGQCAPLPTTCAGFADFCGNGDRVTCCDGLMCQAGTCCKLPGQSCEGAQDCCVVQGDPTSGTCTGVCAGNPVCSDDGDCPAGQICVDGACQECGVDGDCASDRVCDGGVCVCPVGTSVCGSGCIPDGACCTDADCPSGRVCADGECAARGECEVDGDCGGGQVCVDGVCRCPGDTALCDGTCVDTLNDAANCGGCGNTCANPEHGEALCAGGVCGVTCDDDFAACGLSCLAAAVCCSDADCASGQTCEDGACVAATTQLPRTGSGTPPLGPSRTGWLAPATVAAVAGVWLRRAAHGARSGDASR